jgi:hypothetical protein
MRDAGRRGRRSGSAWHAVADERWVGGARRIADSAQYVADGGREVNSAGHVMDSARHAVGKRGVVGGRWIVGCV